MQKIKDELLPLTSIRFVAALYVFVFHIHMNWPLTGPGHLSSVLLQGAVGMSIFFILSGFILAHRYSQSDFGLRGYALSRFARIYPVYIAAAVITTPWLIISLARTSQDAAHFGLKSFCLLISNVFLVQAWFPQMFTYWNDGGSWSIATEAFFYTLFPAVLYAVRRLGKREITFVALAAYVFSSSIALVFFSFEEKPVPAVQIFYAMPIFRFPEFLIGVCAYFLSKDLELIKKSDAYIVALIAVTIAYLSFFQNATPFYITHNWLVVPVIACLLVLLAKGQGVIPRLMSARAFVFGGRVSYCFYSFQTFMILFLLSCHDFLVARIGVLADNRILLCVAFILLMTISILGYFYIEEPARIGIIAGWKGRSASVIFRALKSVLTRFIRRTLKSWAAMPGDASRKGARL
ncbi:acyltransferase [Methylocystis sp. IM3]|uniref:acyltransferase family protein n=2 Tax=Methylocystis TaxID=133 RepID=UPI000F92026F|nr:MAG: acyltransferase [Hyphomicrobiales bacterium]